MNEVLPDNNQPQPIRYWKSLDELQGDPEVLKLKANEFMAGVTDDFRLEEMSQVSRKQFLSLMAASAAFTLTGCKNYRDNGEIIPYNKQPEEITLGVPNFYASTCTGCASACGTLVKTREGRPIKIDGNPEHPVNQGKLCVKGQAAIFHLYDPDRLQAPLNKQSKVSWKDADSKIIDGLNQAQQAGKQIVLLTPAIHSPTLHQVIMDFKAKYSQTKLYAFTLQNDHARQSAWQKSYGSGTFPLLKWDAADIVLSLDADFLGREGNTIETLRLFSQKRDVMSDKTFSRLYVAEGNMSITGMNADYRLRLRPDAQYELVMGLLHEVAGEGDMTLADVGKKHQLDAKVLEHLVSDLKANQGKALVYASDKLPEAVHVAVNALNHALGADALYRQEANVQFHDMATIAELDSLVQAMAAGQVGAIIHVDTNPLFDLPADLGYDKGLEKVPLSVTLTKQASETSVKSTYTLPLSHDLESWGDAKTRTGVYSLQQPVIAPIYDSREAGAALLTWLSGSADSFKAALYHDYVIAHWQKQIFPTLNLLVDFKTFWNAALHNGVVKHPEKAPALGSFKANALAQVTAPESGKDFVLVLEDNYSIGSDGKYANNGWLQELPHPVSKIVWDNYAAISVSLAHELQVKNDDLVDVKVGNRSIKLPVLLQPGMADKVIAIELGYGRTDAGTVGSNVGTNANSLLTKEAKDSPWIYNQQVSIQKAGSKKHLVTTQLHHSFDEELIQDLHYKRAIVHEANYPAYLKDPNSAKMHRHPSLNIVTMHEYPDIKWAMAIDTNKCVSCNICVAACNVENNLPVVGPDQVNRGREMHWMRIDRYYSGAPEAPVVSTQPMLCQHCDNAPCEAVCPVAATNHSPDGLNQMAYNRCVGTRYCSNNCPYKVRRFNFFDYREEFAKGYQQQQSFALLHNPEVTVRSRGVMEKCTFCVQRIMEARQEAVKANQPLKGSDVVTACQQACPVDAIVFGDMNDPQSSVAKYRKHVTGYHVLEEVNARPNVTYVAKLRNTLETHHGGHGGAETHENTHHS